MIIKIRQDAEKERLTEFLDGLTKLNTVFQFEEDIRIITLMKFSDSVMGLVRKTSVVEEMLPANKAFVLASKHRFKPKSTVRLSKDIEFGGRDIVLIAGPCSVETEEQMMQSAKAVKDAGASILRGGAFKPRTSPYDFQGLGESGLKFIRKAANKHGLKVITEILDPRHVDLVNRYTDIFQVGTRNMQNFELLKELGKMRKPVLLKRGMGVVYKEWLGAAEYILAGGNKEVILCERGIRTFVADTRFTFDINAIPYIKKVSHLPIVADPSHSTGNWHFVKDIAMAAVAAGADGLIIDAHPEPQKSWVDKDQAIDFKTLKDIIKRSNRIAKIVRN
ncbi:3-deoxy-7-phosphoheptulonate synthase [Candidatus Roizmanbacteria bacterium RIFCSPHIGHO2_01_FULL_39_8]|uniref:3-deoxy-7-phosphoheptulonate synthase n=1 Tax=Candidatus Roizmanbacteria bacterium RIFCSPHIGHO2_01_FULL_39_8 TaxID=1802033 RepID=A0A1F7GJC0_9BACT|nr:MAG: 3-deoxy-7-phosphoheptulonate synthase [Candidatus Roizmanbacteria bacterium RIFCSPHIGHO2_01_FULL_39_8]